MRVLAALVDAGTCARWLARIDACAAALPPGHPDVQATSDSLRLAALGAAFDEIVERLPALPGSLLRDHCWARRQHPPGARPPGVFAHHWHQDGALGSRFAAGDRLRDLQTLWLPLMDCGVDAPSLEWLDASTNELMHPADLRDEAIAARFGQALRRHAVLAAGDALVFGGEVLHRTHVTPAMTQRRVSVELRFAAG